MLVLKPSKIHGVGVFTTTALKRGTRLPLSAQTRDWRLVPTVRGFLSRYCTRSKDGCIYAPKDPHRMSIGWYMNHSARPNTVTTNDDWRIGRNVRAGEELTIDYLAHEAGL
jgi:hypothetical protein